MRVYRRPLARACGRLRVRTRRAPDSRTARRQAMTPGHTIHTDMRAGAGAQAWSPSCSCRPLEIVMSAAPVNLSKQNNSAEAINHAADYAVTVAGGFEMWLRNCGPAGRRG